MTLPEISIRRHVLAWMISAVFVLLGIISFQKIGIDKFPTIDFPTKAGKNPVHSF